MMGILMKETRPSMPGWRKMAKVFLTASEKFLTA